HHEAGQGPGRPPRARGLQEVVGRSGSETEEIVAITLRVTSPAHHAERDGYRRSGRWDPYRQASPHRPGTAPALGLRAGDDVRDCIADQLGEGESTMSFPSWLQNLRSALNSSRH